MFVKIWHWKLMPIAQHLLTFKFIEEPEDFDYSNTILRDTEDSRYCVKFKSVF